MPERASRITWLGSAGYAAGGSLATVGVLSLLALVGWLALAPARQREAGTEMANSLRGFDATLGVTIGAVLLAQALVAVLLPLPLQATALSIRRRGVDATAFAKVAALTVASTLVSFFALYPALSAFKLMLETADVQAFFLAGALALLYLVHALSLAVGRRFARAP